MSALISIETREAAKRLIVEIVAQARTIEGRVRLYKAFYAAHLFYWQDYSTPLTDYPIVHMPFGPGIDEGAKLVAELEYEGSIRVSSRPKGPYREDVFEWVEGKRAPIDDAESSAVRKAIEWVDGKTAAELSQDTHEHSRSWNSTVDGAEMNVYIDALSDEQYELARQKAADARRIVRAAFAAS